MRRRRPIGTLENGADLSGTHEILERNLLAARRAIKALGKTVSKHPGEESELPWLMLKYRVQNSIDVLEDLKKLLKKAGEL